MAQWNKKLSTCRRCEVQTRVRQLLIYSKKSGENGVIFSPLFTANLTIFFDQTSTLVKIFYNIRTTTNDSIQSDALISRYSPKNLLELQFENSEINNTIVNVLIF